MDDAFGERPWPRAMTLVGRRIALAVYQVLEREEPFDAVKFFAS
jgi:hypothetical protein